MDSSPGFQRGASPYPHALLQISGMPELAAALSKVRKLEKIKIYSPNSDHRRAFAAEWEKKLGLLIIAMDEPRCVVVRSDMVIIVNSKAQIEYA